MATCATWDFYHSKRSICGTALFGRMFVSDTIDKIRVRSIAPAQGGKTRHGNDSQRSSDAATAIASGCATKQTGSDALGPG